MSVKTEFKCFFAKERNEMVAHAQTPPRIKLVSLGRGRRTADCRELKKMFGINKVRVMKRIQKTWMSVS